MKSPDGKKASLFPVALVFGLVGLVPLGLGLHVYLERREFVSTAETSEGEVVEIFLASSRARTGGDDLNSYAPTVRFVTTGGQAVEFRASVSSSDPGYRVGDRVAVLYSPGSPEGAIIDSFFHLWMAPTILLGLGGVCTLLGIAVALLAYREARSGRPPLPSRHE